MNKIYNPEKAQWKTVLKRPTPSVSDIEEMVNAVFMEIRTGGDTAVRNYTKKFDGADLQDFLTSPKELKESELLISDDLKAAIQQAKNNIEKFHKAQKTENITIETTDRVHCWQEKMTLQKVRLYIPGRTAPLFSTRLMLAIPANIASCKEIVLCTPPNKQGKVL